MSAPTQIVLQGDNRLVFGGQGTPFEQSCASFGFERRAGFTPSTNNSFIQEDQEWVDYREFCSQFEEFNYEQIVKRLFAPDYTYRDVLALIRYAQLLSENLHLLQTQNHSNEEKISKLSELVDKKHQKIGLWSNKEIILHWIMPVVLTVVTALVSTWLTLLKTGQI